MDKADLGQITRPKENATDNSHTFPTNVWIHKITKGKGSDRCNLCRVLWIEEDRFRTEKMIPEQTLGHIQYT
jgi:hypothetical protein